MTVAVPVKDRRERMRRCLESLLAIDYPAYDVLVLDNGSTDGTVEACRELAAESRVPVRIEVVEGSVGHVRNVGARLASGELIAYTDSDCMVDPGWLAAVARPFDDPEVGVVTGRTLPATTPRPEDGWFATIEVTEQTWRFESCNLLFRREPFCATAGFDEDVGHFWEDAPAGWGMVLGGWKAVYEPEAVVRHDVTYPGVRWHLARGRKYGHVAAAVRRYPELREHLLWGRYFLRPRNAIVAAAAAGLLLAARDRRALVLALPYAFMRFPREPALGAVRWQAILLAFDANILYGMLRNSARFRTLVL